MRRRMLAITHCVCTIYASVSAAVPLFCHPGCFCKQPCQRSLATSLLAASKPAALLLEEVRRVLPALRRLSLLVSPVVAWLDLANFSQRLRSTCTIYPLQQQLQQLFLASGLISNPCSVQKRAPVLVLLCPDNHGIEEDALQIFSSTDISSSLRGPHCTDCN